MRCAPHSNASAVQCRAVASRQQSFELRHDERRYQVSRIILLPFSFFFLRIILKRNLCTKTIESVKIINLLPVFLIKR